MRKFWKVYVGRGPYEAERITLEQAAEERRYGSDEPREANYIVEAFNESDARRVASMARQGQTLTWMCGPRKAVPVQIPDVKYADRYSCGT